MNRFIIITYIPYKLSKNNTYIVDKLWAWELKAFINSSDLQIHVFAPHMEERKIECPYEIPTDHLTFHSLPYFDLHYTKIFKFIIRIPQIFFVLIKNITKQDLVHIPGTAIPPIGYIANIVCIIKRCEKRIFVLDADFVGDLDLFISKNQHFKKYFYIFLKNVYLSIFIFHIKISPLTFVFGDALFQRYKKYGNVFKVYGSWIQKKDIIQLIKLEKKLKINFPKKSKVKLCFVAQLKPKKNPLITIDIIKKLLEKDVPVQLDIWGEGPLKNILEETIQKYELNNLIKLKGIIPYGDPFYKVLRQYDAILVPNLSGEQPRIIFDALANGVVVIGSNIKSFSIIINYKNGILCDQSNPNNFADAVEKLYNDKILFNDLIKNGIKTVEENTMETVYNKRMKIIKNTFDI